MDERCFRVPPGDLERLRALASRQAEIAAGDGMAKLYTDWLRHGSFAPGARPMVTVELWTFADEILPGLMECESPRGRELERTLLMNLIPRTMFGDDTPVRGYLPVPVRRTFDPLGMKVRKITAGDSDAAGAGHRFLYHIDDLVEQWSRLGKTRYAFDLPGTQREIDWINELVGDILPARRCGETMDVHVAEDILHLMSMETLYVAMLEAPELVHRMIGMLAADYMKWLDDFEALGLLPTASDELLPQGSFCFTDLLPSVGTGLRTEQVWGSLDAEEMDSVSPEMYREFITEHYIPLARRFGALSFGCCEAVHRFWEGSVERLPNLRKVSVSAWCDVDYMGERLRGREIVFHRKPSANFLGVGRDLDEDAVRKYFRRTARAASGCRLEISQRDVYLLHGNTEKVRRYVELIRETLDREWRP